MAAVIVRPDNSVEVVCRADLWEPCPTHHVVHHEAVVTVTTVDEWFAPLPRGPRKRDLFLSFRRHS